MRTFRLTSRQRQRLRAQLKITKDGRVAKRIFALLALDRGRRPTGLATTLGITRQTLYNWVLRFEIDGTPSALTDRRRSGRPTKWTEPVRRFLSWSLEQPPDALGYASGTWTVPLLRGHVERWMGVCVSDSAMRDELHRLGYRWKRPRYVLQPDPDREKKRRIRREIRDLPAGTLVLAQDETDVMLFPPLRAAWARRGQQARVWLSGRNARRVIFGTLNLRTGHLVLLSRPRQRAQDFSAFLRELRRRHRDRPLALLLDEDSSHTARASQQLAARLHIRLLWLPIRCPALNPMEHLWRAAKQNVCANRQDVSIDLAVLRVLRYLRRLTPREALRKAGALSPQFWLRAALSNHYRRPT